MDKHFIIKNRCVSTDSALLIADNGDYTAVFAVDQEWMDRDIIARFLLPDGSYCDTGLSDSLTCLIPPEALTSSDVRVGLYSGEMATMPCRVQVCPSIKTGVVQAETQPPQELHTYGFADSGLTDVLTSGAVAVTLGANQTIAFTFTGTGFDLNFHPVDANIQMSVYKADDYEVKSYAYGSTTMLYASKKPGATGGVIRTQYKNYRPETPEQRQEIIFDGIHNLDNGEYLAVVTRFTGTESAEILGLKILIESEAQRGISADV